ncbi:hypothetical protein WJX81_004069 [Elliptochloris bilobata]|uniref:Tryptophan synthase beta chain-like PALP domain-containing protein n=1 Tax=Elliptochloris bilobata TaxID=381761 RepID=A0AAW1RBR3_9CHLO
MRALHELETYTPPPWVPSALKVPEKRFALGLLPTPAHRWAPRGVPEGCEMWIKRDDLSGMQLSGNKVRKLEFLIAQALEEGADTVVTLGGIQSNHARATAVAARYAGLDAHLILRHSRTAMDDDPGLTGNLLVERMVGAHVHLVTKEEYQSMGSVALGERLVERLRAAGRRPFLIPVGGSSSVGSWGYLEAVREIEAQAGERPFTDIAVACGSGGTVAGLALGVRLSGAETRVHAYGVCDDEEYFYDFIDKLLSEAGASRSVVGAEGARGLLRMAQAKGSGYAISQQDELKATLEVAQTTGVLLDPVYSGKAWVALAADMAADPEAWRGRRVLFLHTGGLLGMYDKVGQLQPLVEALGRCERMDVSA